MTELLIKLFIKNKENVADPKVRSSYGNLASITSILCNALLFAGKFIAGLLSGSIAIMADAINNLSDTASNVISLLGFKLASKKPDPIHPYGHGRFEYLSGLAVSILIILVGYTLGRESVMKIIHPETTVFSWLTIAILAVSILVKLWMSLFNKKIGERINSGTLIATATDSKNDVISTAAVLVSIIISHYTNFFMLDGIIGLGVALFILWSGADLVKETIAPLLGKAPDAEFVKSIEDKVLSYPGILGIHDLIVHDYGPGRQFISLHAEVAADRDVLEAHSEIDDIESDFMNNEGLNVTIHYDPIVTNDERIGELKNIITDALVQLGKNYMIHDLRIVPGDTHTNVIFDMVLPAGSNEDCQKLKEYIASKLKECNEKYNTVIKFDEDFSGMCR